MKDIKICPKCNSTMSRVKEVIECNYCGYANDDDFFVDSLEEEEEDVE